MISAPVDFRILKTRLHDLPPQPLAAKSTSHALSLPLPIWASPPRPPRQHPCLPHADGGLHTRSQVKATVIHKGRLILPMHSYSGPSHGGQQRDEVILLCAQCQGQTWQWRGSRGGGRSWRSIREWTCTLSPYPVPNVSRRVKQEGLQMDLAIPGLDSGGRLEGPGQDSYHTWNGLRSAHRGEKTVRTFQDRYRHVVVRPRGAEHL